MNTASSLPLATNGMVQRETCPRPLGSRRHFVPGAYDIRPVLVLVLAACVLSVGWAGVLLPGWSAGELLGGGDNLPQDEGPPMVELATTLESAPSATEVPVETTPAAEPVETPPEPVTVVDAFEIPAPPEIVKPLAVAETSPERPRPAAPATQPRRAAPSNSGSASPAVSSTPGGGAGPKSGAGRAGKAKTPQPPYPSFARAGKMTGTVVVSIVVENSGSVASASVARSCGFPALDNYTTGYIRRSWHWPEGARRTFAQSVTFRLR